MVGVPGGGGFSFAFLLGLRRGVGGGLFFLVIGMVSLVARAVLVAGHGGPGIGHSGLLLCQQRR